MSLTIIPELWRPLIRKAILNSGNLIKQGAIKIDYDTPLRDGDSLLRMAYLKDIITSSDDDVKITSSTDVTPEVFDDYAEYGVVIRRGKGWKVTNIEQYERGKDIMREMVPQIGEYLASQIQMSYKSVLTGIFDDTAGVLTDSHRYVVGGAEIMTLTELSKSKQLLGEYQSELQTLIVHSEVASKLWQDGLILEIQAPQFKDALVTTGTIQTVAGLRMIMNDTVCAKSGDYYPSYIIGGQPLYTAFQKEFDIYPNFTPATGGGQHEVYVYQHYVPHVMGVSYTSSTMNPDRSGANSLETAGAWTKVDKDENIKIVQILSKVA